jgi:hypothetical protein
MDPRLALLLSAITVRSNEIILNAGVNLRISGGNLLLGGSDVLAIPTGDSNIVVGSARVVGYGNIVSSDDRQDASVVTGNFNLVVGSSHEVGASRAVALGFGHSVMSDDSTIAGGERNAIQANALGAFIGAGFLNSVFAPFASVVSGKWNSARGVEAFVGGGNSNVASGERSCVACGWYNTASGDKSFCGTGYGNRCAGNYSVIATGYSCAVGGFASGILAGQQNGVNAVRSGLVGGYMAQID